MHSEIIDSTFRGLRTYGDGCGVIPCKLTAHSMGCDGNGVGGSMELLKAFKSRPGTYGWKHSPGEQIKVKN